MTAWLTTILIFLPLAGALVVWLAAAAARRSPARSRRSSRWSRSGVWIIAVERFDFGEPALQLEQRTSGSATSHVSYHVGQYGFSLWLVGLTVVCGARRVRLRLVGRPRARPRLLRRCCSS